MVPRGCVAVYVGEERQRFVIPIMYLSHPFITRLLASEEAEGELAYTYGGPLTVPCDVGDFEQVKWLVDRETNAASLNFRP
jgi:SAUR family protein